MIKINKHYPDFHKIKFAIACSNPKDDRPYLIYRFIHITTDIVSFGRGRMHVYRPDSDHGLPHGWYEVIKNTSSTIWLEEVETIQAPDYDHLLHDNGTLGVDILDVEPGLLQGQIYEKIIQAINSPGYYINIDYIRDLFIQKPWSLSISFESYDSGLVIRSERTIAVIMPGRKEE